MKRKILIILSIIMLFTMIASFASCEKSTSSNTNDSGIKYDVSLTVACEENLFFSKYDTDIYIDKNFEGTVYHGEKVVLELELSKGTHTIRFEKNDDNTVYGTQKIKIDGDCSFGFKIHCKNNKIEIDKLIITESETTQDTSNHMTDDSSPESTTDSDIDNSIPMKLSKEFAQRAIMVSVTNRSSPYVYSNDGNSYDTSKFHTYSDTSIFYAETHTLGNWESLNEMTWRVSDMKLHLKGIDISTYIKISADISLTDEYIFLSNISIAQGRLDYLDSNDPNRLDIVTYSAPTDHTPYFIVPHTLIMEDRDSITSDDTILNNARITFENYGKSLYPLGFDCNWILGTLSKEVYADGSCYFMVEATIKSNNGTKERVLASGKVSNNTVYNFNIDTDY